MEPAVEDATVEHMMPGRVRLRFRSKRNDIGFFEELIRLLSQFAAVTSVEANPQTGSVLVRHSATEDELIHFASLIGIVDPEELALETEVEAVLGDREALARSPSIEALGLIALAIVQFRRGRVLGSASEQFWMASRLGGTRYFAARAALLGLGFFQLMSGHVLAPASSLLTYALMTEAMPMPSREAQGASRPGLQP